MYVACFKATVRNNAVLTAVEVGSNAEAWIKCFCKLLCGETDEAVALCCVVTQLSFCSFFQLIKRSVAASSRTKLK